MWTKFDDMYSGGYTKTDFKEIWIELPENEACEYFEKKFGESPNGMTCICCGPDYHIDEYSECLFSRSTDTILVIHKENL